MEELNGPKKAGGGGQISKCGMGRARVSLLSCALWEVCDRDEPRTVGDGGN